MRTEKPALRKRFAAERVDQVLRTSGVITQEEYARDMVVLRQHRENGENLISAHDDDCQVVGIVGPKAIHQGNLCRSAPSGAEVLKDDAVLTELRQTTPPGQQGNVVPCLFQSRRVKAAEYAGTDNQGSHGDLLTERQTLPARSMPVSIIRNFDSVRRRIQ